MSRIILFNADDWGLSRRIHDAITTLHRNKAIDAAGIMMGQAFTADAVAYAKAHPDLWTGIHLFGNDDDCTPLTRDAWPRPWPDLMAIHASLVLPPVRKLVLAEVRAQLEAYKRTGLRLCFVNSHLHFHVHPAIDDGVLGAIREIFPRFDGWLRLGDTRLFSGGVPDPLMGTAHGIIDLIARLVMESKWTGRKNDTLWGINRNFRNSAAEIAETSGKLRDGFHEFYFHPGRDKELPGNGTDEAALLRLAEILPRSARIPSDFP